MPFVFGILGTLFIVAGVRGQSKPLFALIKSDFSGTPNYFEWMIAIFAVGAFGYIKELSTISRLFMILVLAGLLYENKNVFSQTASETSQQPTSTTVQPSTSTVQQQNTGLQPLQQLPQLTQDESLLA
jgi:hypothetical protein